jgi:hypothetical protein
LLGSSQRVSSSEAGSGSGRLVYAVSALDHDGHPLLGTRGVDATTGLGGLAPRAALGLAMLTEQNAAPGFTALWTGSSMSTAVLSALAARLWGQDASLESRSVMRRIDAGLAPAPDPIPPTLCQVGASCPPSYGVARWCNVIGGACPQGPTRPVLVRLQRSEDPGLDTRTPAGDVVPQPGPITCSECSLQVLPTSVRLDLRLASGVTADSLLLYDAAALKHSPPLPSRTVPLEPGTLTIGGVTAPLAASVRLRSAAGTTSFEQLLIARP